MNKDGHVLNAALLAIGLGVVLTVDVAVGVERLVISGVTAETSAGGEEIQTHIDFAVQFGKSVLTFSVPIILGALFPDVDTAFGRHRKTLHNLPVLMLFMSFPPVFGNLQFVWIGVATHYLLDVVGSKRGIALFYPLSATEYDIPTGVATSSRWTTGVTLAVTIGELIVLFIIHTYIIALDSAPTVINETLIDTSLSQVLLLCLNIL
ncbi:metal-dependent hydrolase [Haloquadratum walsbyi]|uniref:Putative membrane-bound metal-dependent hydrolase (DUF457) n=1 Tax=Haloquadratum walsbyi J07HQW2 TaxID=1238425 RepID=U1NHQ0_9EURY|nr:metal-dependent hydrolase [Haloquadratum walsbyi]ERG96388.1 MAG: putative membrane-bound metal-dependent hydrolase (DUF457) [Haloquadratum walsbyi J07HQW2]